MIRKCDRPGCPNEYEYTRRSSRFCSDRCRAKNNGAPKPEDRRQPMFVPDENDPVEILQQRKAARTLIAEGRVAEGEAALATAMRKWDKLSWDVRDPKARHPDNPKNWL